MERYLALLREVIARGRRRQDPLLRQHRGRHAGPLPGYARTADWNATYGWLTATLLNTSGLAQYRPRGTPAEDDAGWRLVRSANSPQDRKRRRAIRRQPGGNYLAILQVDELRPPPAAMLGALTNALTVRRPTVNLQPRRKAAALAIRGSLLPIRPYKRGGRRAALQPGQ